MATFHECILISLRLRKDIRTLFANHSVCNAVTTPTALSADEVALKLRPLPTGGPMMAPPAQSSPAKRRELLCEYLTNVFGRKYLWQEMVWGQAYF